MLLLLIQAGFSHGQGMLNTSQFLFPGGKISFKCGVDRLQALSLGKRSFSPGRLCRNNSDKQADKKPSEQADNDTVDIQ